MLNQNKTYFIETYGCQMNVADSEIVETLLIDKGYKKSLTADVADALFINTCAIRDHAEVKVHSRLGNYFAFKQKKPEMVIGVLGCMAQSLKEDILENKPYVDIVLGPDSYRNLPSLLDRYNEDKTSKVDTVLSRHEVYDDLFPSRKIGINAWVSIMRGCDKFCTFCIVPFTRGRERSRSVNGIISEVENAVNEGFVEITLLGQNVNSYKHNNDGFSKLLKEVSSVKGVERIRYTSPHPSDINTELLQVMRDSTNICNYIHLPLQAGSNRILKRMNRTYDRDHFINLAKEIKSIIPNCGISTDIIVGFPGETKNEFNKTLDVMNEVRFDSAYTFKYSERRGTKAIQYEDKLNEPEKQFRLEKVIALQREHTLQNNKEYVGRIENVLIEKTSKRSENHWAGRTDSNKWVIFEKKKGETIKDNVGVKIFEAKGLVLKGKRVISKVGVAI